MYCSGQISWQISTRPLGKQFDVVSNWFTEFTCNNKSISKMTWLVDSNWEFQNEPMDLFFMYV